MSHSSDRTGREVQARLPITDVKNLMFSNSAYSAVNKIVPNEGAEERDGYLMSVTDPTETRARLNDVDFSLKARYLTFRKVTPEIYDNMKSQILKMNNTGFIALKQLRGIYSDKEVCKLIEHRI
jgi:hypothetical protein